jgi:glycosyltransferase involved in cell wall biosynthesis
MYQYLPELERQGISVTPAQLFDDAYLLGRYSGNNPALHTILRYYGKRLRVLLSARRYDLVWMEYEAFPWLPFGEGLLHLSRVPCLIDYDDAIFHRYDNHERSWVRWLLGGKIDRVMRGAAAVIAGNPYIARRARAVGARQVDLIPTVVDLKRYHPRPPVRSEGPITVGWIGSPVTARYLEQVAESLCTVSRQRPVRLLAVGAGSLELAGVEVVNRPWSEAAEVELIRNMDIGIMPLPDAPWERGKCGYKLIQYMACAVPVIASPVGVNRDLVVPGQTGLLATTPAEWTAALLQLATNEQLRAELGRGGRKLVEENYCLQRTAPLLATLMQQIVGKEQSSCAG